MSKKGLFYILVLVIVMIGCGGGGGGGGGGSTGSVSLSPSSANLDPGEQVIFTATVTGINPASVSWSWNGGSLSINGNQATYTAGGVAGNFSVSATSTADPSKSDSSPITITNVSILDGIIVQFYDENGVLLASATTDLGGNYTVSVPTRARFLQLDPNSIQTANFHRAYRFMGKRYTPLSGSCKAPIPTLPSGGSITLATIFLPPSSDPPPPPPDGCGSPAIGTGTTGSATVSGSVASD